MCKFNLNKNLNRVSKDLKKLNLDKLNLGKLNNAHFNKQNLILSSAIAGGVVAVGTVALIINHILKNNPDEYENSDSFIANDKDAMHANTIKRLKKRLSGSLDVNKTLLKSLSHKDDLINHLLNKD